MNPSTAIPGKYKSLIGLAVASQIPCKFCIIADTEFAKLEGATDRELTEAVAMAGLRPPLEHDPQRPPGRQGGFKGHQSAWSLRSGVSGREEQRLDVRRVRQHVERRDACSAR